MNKKTLFILILLLLYFCFININTSIKIIQSGNIQIVNDLNFLEEFYNSTRRLNHELNDLRTTIVLIDNKFSPYNPIPNFFYLEGRANESEPIISLHWDHKNDINWIIRDLQFCFRSTQNHPFNDLKLFEVEWIGYLFKISLADASSLDSNLTKIWKQNNLDHNFRGDSIAFSRFVRLRDLNLNCNAFSSLSTNDYKAIIRRISDYISLHPSLLGNNSRPRDISMGEVHNYINNNVEILFNELIEIPFINIKITYHVFIFLFPFLLAILSYLILIKWNQIEPNNNNFFPRLTFLLNFNGEHKIFNIIFYLLIFISLTFSFLISTILSFKFKLLYLIIINIIIFLLIIYLFLIHRRIKEKA